MEYYFGEKGFDVCRIDGGVKLDERKRQVRACERNIQKWFKASCVVCCWSCFSFRLLLFPDQGLHVPKRCSVMLILESLY